MRGTVFWILPLLVFAPALWAGDKPKTEPAKDKEKPKAQKPATPAEQYKALIAELQKELQTTQKAFNEAKNQEERQKIFTDYQKKVQSFASRFLDLAQKNPKDDVAVDALQFVLNIAPSGPNADKAVDLLLKDHVQSKKIGQVCQALAGRGSPSAEKLMRAVLDKNKDHNVQGQVSLGLGQLLKNKADRPGLKPAEATKLTKEAEDLFDTIVHKYADLKGLVEQAKGELFEIRHLAIGKVAPNIQGEDADGKKFQLKDYHGKVVVLDFWARW